ncbi:hypothetical protein [Mycetocola reblochoni]|uniref:DUF1579 domain-containing protein n=2 Tax=Mycetocola reblochoni TaxID=331618 RepID=A0A1R4IJM4_9MICO|nr:hypothetical protein [Mycetocola reblochoni]RLP67811.1 hypothetical protein D9V30_12560 [Mycetocola reblochoni]SJN19971.1 hypothetical protein FM119_02110 [Mycetocola reblochoni REB411]
MNAPAPDPLLGVLSADGPSSRYPHRIATFGRLVGRWAVTSTRREREGADWEDVVFTWTVGYILDGRGVQDVAVVDDDAVPGGVRTVSTTVRVYDPLLGAWRVSYLEPERGEYAQLIASAHRDGIRQDGTRSDDKLIRWNFSGITGERYLWDSWVSDDEGASWWLQAHNEGRRLA